jgi:hypothetical protein
LPVPPAKPISATPSVIDAQSLWNYLKEKKSATKDEENAPITVLNATKKQETNFRTTQPYNRNSCEQLSSVHTQPIFYHSSHERDTKYSDYPLIGVESIEV